MSARRCSTCGVTWPLDKTRCPICHDPTDFFKDTEPDADWSDKLASHEASAARPTTVGAIVGTDTQTTNYRMERFHAAGLDLDLAQRLATNRSVHPSRFEDLVNKGCSPMLAYEILA